MQKFLLIIPIIALVACGGNSEQYEYDEVQPAAVVQTDPDYTIALDCADWRVYGDVYGNTIELTAENIYVPKNVELSVRSFNAELTKDSDHPAVYSGVANTTGYCASLEFPMNPQTDPIYTIEIKNDTNSKNTYRYRNICRLIYDEPVMYGNPQ